MTSLAENVIQDAAQEIPNVPALQVGSAAVQTLENPSPSVLVSDIELLHQIVLEVKTKLAGKHISLYNLIKAFL